jgi:hypothetical protein
MLSHRYAALFGQHYFYYFLVQIAPWLSTYINVKLPNLNKKLGISYLELERGRGEER